jgi:hypothetical protein
MVHSNDVEKGWRIAASSRDSHIYVATGWVGVFCKTGTGSTRHHLLNPNQQYTMSTHPGSDPETTAQEY